VRRGQEVNYSVYVMHRRHDLWGPDADEFVPERWTGRRPGWEYLPFNGGPRVCLGQQFALTEAGYVICRMLQRFDAIEKAADFSDEELHSCSLTTAPVAVSVRLHQAVDLGKR
jgi:cytochrome P450